MKVKARFVGIRQCVWTVFALVITAGLLSAVCQTQAASQMPKRGGILRVSTIGVDHLDPTVTSNNPMQQVAEPVYERLLRLRAQSFDDNILEPWLAKSWEVSNDGLTWTIRLQPNVRWQNLPPVNGRKFTSADIAWNIDYYKSKSAFNYLWAPVVKYETPDENTIVLHLDRPRAGFLNLLGAQYNHIMPREIFERDGDFKSRMVGTGPFQLKEWVKGVKVAFDRNPNYWDVSELDKKPLPYLDGMELVIMLDYSARLAALRARQSEMHYTDLRGTDLDSLKKSNPDMTFAEFPSPNAHGIMMNVSQPPWNDVRMRRALSYAIDRQAYIDIMFDGKGSWNVYVPPAEFRWTQEKVKEKFKQNKELARQLLKEAGYKGEPILWTGYPGGAVQNTPDSGSIIFQQAKEVGFNFKPEWLADNVAQRQRFVAGTWGTAFWSISFFGWDPDDYLGFFDSKSPSTLNFSRVKDPVLDKMNTAQSSEMNPARRKELLDKVQDYLYDKMYFIPVAREYYYRARQGYVKMNPIHYSVGYPGLERAWLDK